MRHLRLANAFVGSGETADMTPATQLCYIFVDWGSCSTVDQCGFDFGDCGTKDVCLVDY